jgi:hypothetical protein
VGKISERSRFPGVWDRVLAALLAAADARVGCPRRIGLVAALRERYRDPRPPARGGGEKGGGDEALGKSKGGFSTKLHLRGEGIGKPITSGC